MIHGGFYAKIRHFRGKKLPHTFTHQYPSQSINLIILLHNNYGFKKNSLLHHLTSLFTLFIVSAKKISWPNSRRHRKRSLSHIPSNHPQPTNQPIQPSAGWNPTPSNQPSNQIQRSMGSADQRLQMHGSFTDQIHSSRWFCQRFQLLEILGRISVQVRGPVDGWNGWLSRRW